MPSLLSIDNVKTIKGEKLGYRTLIMYLSPFTDNSKGVNLCPFASTGCADACLYTAGRGRFDNVKNGRRGRTERFLADREQFLRDLLEEITVGVRRARKAGMTPVVRLNGTSDISWESFKVDGKTLMEHFPDVQFYDYTKNITRLRRELPSNYHLTFSRSESNQQHVEEALALGYNVAVVFHDVPDVYLGRPVVAGDDHDLTFIHPAGVVLGLKAKGSAKKDTSGFVV